MSKLTSKQQPNTWVIIVARGSADGFTEYLAEDRHDDRGGPYWVGNKSDPFVLQFEFLANAARALAPHKYHPGARLECLKIPD